MCAPRPDGYANRIFTTVAKRPAPPSAANAIAKSRLLKRGQRSTCVRYIYGIYRCCTHPPLFLFSLPGQAGCLCPVYCHASPLADPGSGHRRGIRRRCRASMKMKRMKSEVISATIESYLKRRHYQVQCRGELVQVSCRAWLAMNERVRHNLLHRCCCFSRTMTFTAREISCFVKTAIRQR